MRLLGKITSLVTRTQASTPSVDEVEITVWGLKARVTRKMSVPGPHEVSVYIPRLEITNKVTEGNKTTETSVVLNSLTIVSSPLRPPTDSPPTSPRSAYDSPVSLRA